MEVTSETLCLALIRDYLSRKQFLITLHNFDSEIAKCYPNFLKDYKNVLRQFDFSGINQYSKVRGAFCLELIAQQMLDEYKKINGKFPNDMHYARSLQNISSPQGDTNKGVGNSKHINRLPEPSEGTKDIENQLQKTSLTIQHAKQSSSKYTPPKELDVKRKLIRSFSDSMTRQIDCANFISDSDFYAERPITIEECNQLRILLFGDQAMNFGDDWLNQGFKFRENGQTYGLIQNKPGPCGFLAAIQGHLLYEFLFGYAQSAICMSPSIDEKKLALSRALTFILFQAGEDKEAIIALKEDQFAFDENAQFVRDELLEYLHLKIFRKKEYLYEFLDNTMDYWMGENNASCVVFLYSVLLTRGIENIHNEMDVSDSPLIGEDGYSSMELVNLLLVGRAVTNPFDGSRYLGADNDRQTFHGIVTQSRIGFLSVLNYSGNVDIGSNYKNPTYPIWVLNNGTHFSVLFSTSLNVLYDMKPKDKFCLFHYDGLANQSEKDEYLVEIIKENLEKKDSTTFFVELCILSKWPNAKITRK